MSDWDGDRPPLGAEPADTNDTACAVCAEVLSAVTSDEDGHEQVITWLHVAEFPGGKGVDHPAVPVRRSEIVTHTRCDFCSTQRPAWILPVKPFRFDSPIPGNGTHVSGSDWLACDVCARLIKKDRWRDLTKRVILAFAAAHGLNANDPRLLGHMESLHTQIRLHRTGPVQRMAAEFVA